MLAPPKLRVLALLSLVSACAPAPPKAPGDSKLRIGDGPAPVGYVALGRIEGTHGEGCGVFGHRGNAAGAMQALRNAALARGADYLRITKTTEPSADRSCVSHVYKAEGVAYRKPAPPPKAPAQTFEPFYSSEPGNPLPDSKTRLTPPEQAKILHALFDRYIESGVCAPLPDGSAPPSLEEARADGQFRPAVGDAFAGSFTAPGAQELLLLVHVGECHASAAQRYGTRRFVILQGDTPVLNVETEVTNLGAARDLDLDGMLEVLTVAETTSLGTVRKDAALVSFEGGKLNPLDSFGQVFEDTCASATPAAFESVAISALPGTRPDFRTEKKQSPCPTRTGLP